MQKQKITADEVRRIFDYDHEKGCLVYKIRTGNRVVVGQVAGFFNKTLGYLMVSVNGTHYYVHRLIWLHQYGEWPEQIDHIDHNRVNNKLENIRNVTDGQNKQNKPKQANNTSGVVGVWWHAQRKKWAAEIKVNRHKKHLGLFNSIDEAAQARAFARMQMHPYGAVQC
jgi:hypothetical protein